jgi:hypothetical protein
MPRVGLALYNKEHTRIQGRSLQGHWAILGLSLLRLKGGFLTGVELGESELSLEAERGVFHSQVERTSVQPGLQNSPPPLLPILVYFLWPLPFLIYFAAFLGGGEHHHVLFPVSFPFLYFPSV